LAKRLFNFSLWDRASNAGASRKLSGRQRPDFLELARKFALGDSEIDFACRPMRAVT
jgi:hypothetical protein